MTTALRLATILAPTPHPRRMFAAADMGAILVPASIEAIYQESTGITSGAVGSLVGRILDERYSLARLGELWADGSVAFGGESSKVSTGVYRIYSSDGALSTASVLNATVAGRSYEVTFTIDSIAVAGSGISVNGVVDATFTTVGAKRCIIVALGTSLTIKRQGLACDYQISNVSAKEIPGSHGIQSTAGSRPALAAGGKIDYDGVDDSLVITFPSDMGTNCTVARAVPNGEATILTGQTITTTYTDSTDHCGLVIINRALTATETNQLRRWLNRRAG